jgi:uncharacterized protein (TIRG00374 family)
VNDRARALRRLLGWPLQVALSLGLVLWFVSGVDWAGVKATLRDADKLRVAAAFAALGPIPLIAAERWRNVCVALRLELPRRFFVAATYAAQFAGQFLPSSIGMDAVRFALLWRQRVPLGARVQSLAIDRICGVGGLLVLVFAGLPFVLALLPTGAVLPILTATFVVLAGGTIALFIDRLPLPASLRREWLDRVLSVLAPMRAALATRQTLYALGLAVALHLFAILAVTLLASAFGYHLRFRDLVTVTAAAILVSLLPLSFNGWGVREGAMMLGLSLLAVPRDVALVISFLYGIGAALWSLPGSVLWHRLTHADSENGKRET